MRGNAANEADDAVTCLASWIAFGLQRGLLTPTEVHYGVPPRTKPSKRNLTMSPALVAALAASLGAPDRGENPT